MPRHDPTPPLEPLKRQFLKIIKWGALFSLAIAALAVMLVARGDETIHLHMLIATALGVGLSVMLGIALMSLVFLSSRMGQDDSAADHSQKEDHDDRS
jgi:heme O synthase-like polyprenyltransferase